MATRWITKKGKNSENRHIPINERSRVREKEIKPQNISENKKFETIESFSVEGESFMDALTKILFGKYKNILMDSEPIGDRFYVDHKRVGFLTDIINAGHGAFVYTVSKDGEKYALYGTATKNGDIWHIDAELSEYIG
ncbi:MAG: hypothetical protein RXO36_07120 [Candidatus Nanopusillus acidilobi]